MLKLEYTNQFKRDLKLAKKRHKDISELEKVVDLLLQDKSLPDKYRNHKLSGDYNNHWECHLEPDWLLIYLKSSEELTLVRAGSHADLFE